MAALGASRIRLKAALAAQAPTVSAHAERVADHADAIARQLGLSASAIRTVRLAALLHDVGKVAMPGQILDKPGPLSAGEYEIVKRHADLGGRMVAALGDPDLTGIVRHHHERVDGGGYPAGLAGEAIPLGARIVAVADTFDAVTSPRPYRQPIATRDALALLEAEAGAQLDAAAVGAFRACRAASCGRRFHRPYRRTTVPAASVARPMRFAAA